MPDPVKANPPVRCPEGCPCDGETMPEEFEIDADDQIANDSCTLCTELNSLVVLKGTNCNYAEGMSTVRCGNATTGGVSPLLKFSGYDSGPLEVSVRYVLGTTDQVVAHYRKIYNAIPLCDQTHTLDKVSEDDPDDLCTWPSTIKVKPV